LAARIHHLEEKLADVVHLESGRSEGLKRNDGGVLQPIKGTVSKTRYYGQSHWLNGADMVSPRGINITDRVEFETC
jgi:hypothetical protein